MLEQDVYELLRSSHTQNHGHNLKTCYPRDQGGLDDAFLSTVRLHMAPVSYEGFEELSELREHVGTTR